MTPEVEELNVADTQYGAKIVKKFDNVFYNKETEMDEATFS